MNVPLPPIFPESSRIASSILINQRLEGDRDLHDEIDVKTPAPLTVLAKAFGQIDAACIKFRQKDM